MARKAPAAKVARIKVHLTTRDLVALFEAAKGEPPSSEKIQRITRLCFGYLIAHSGKQTEDGTIAAFEAALRAGIKFAQDVVSKANRIAQSVALDRKRGKDPSDAAEAIKAYRVYVDAARVIVALDSSNTFKSPPRAGADLGNLTRDLACAVEWPGATEQAVREVVTTLIGIIAPDWFPAIGRAEDVRRTLKRMGWTLSIEKAPEDS